MRWDAIGSLPCPVARALSVVGDRWTMLVLRDAFLGARRFEDFQASLGCSPHVLSTRLAKLVRHAVLARHAYRERPTRHEYRLTEKGRDLYPVVTSLLGWGDRWMREADETPALHLVHTSCGRPTRPVFRCDACGDEILARDVRADLADQETERRPA